MRLWKNAQNRGSERTSSDTQMIYVSNTLHYITLPYLALPSITLHYLTLPYITLHYLTLPYITFPRPTLHGLTLPYLTLPYITLHYLALLYITLHYHTLHYIHVYTYLYIKHVSTHIAVGRQLMPATHNGGPGPDPNLHGARGTAWQQESPRQQGFIGWETDSASTNQNPPSCTSKA